MNIAFPFQIDGHGRTASATDADHARDLIEQILFTNSGERLNRPTFGSGLLQMVFQPNSPELAAALQFTLQASLQQWLDNRVQVQSVDVTSIDSSLQVTVRYVVPTDPQVQTAQFTREI